MTQSQVFGMFGMILLAPHMHELFTLILGGIYILMAVWAFAGEQSKEKKPDDHAV